MFGVKFLGLAISALLTVTPVSFISSTNPLTRTDSAYWRTSYTIDDLGPAAALGTDNHLYTIKYTVDIYCSSACRIVRANYDAAPVSITDTHVQYSYNIRISARKPQAMYDLMNDFTQLNTNTYGMVVENNTYTSDDEIKVLELHTKYAGANGVNEMWVYVEFSATDPLTSIAHDVNELNDWYFVYNFLTDHEVPSTDTQFVTNMISNDNYNQAVEYIQNYYITNSYNDTVYNETVINQYEGKESDLLTLNNTEHQFTIGIESQFQNQIQNISTDNNVTTNTNFQQAAVWVTDKFNRFTVGNAFGAILGFSLLLGFAMAIMGRILR